MVSGTQRAPSQSVIRSWLHSTTRLTQGVPWLCGPASRRVCHFVGSGLSWPAERAGARAPMSLHRSPSTVGEPREIGSVSGSHRDLDHGGPRRFRASNRGRHKAGRWSTTGLSHTHQRRPALRTAGDGRRSGGAVGPVRGWCSSGGTRRGSTVGWAVQGQPIRADLRSTYLGMHRPARTAAHRGRAFSAPGRAANRRARSSVQARTRDPLLGLATGVLPGYRSRSQRTGFRRGFIPIVTQLFSASQSAGRSASLAPSSDRRPFTGGTVSIRSVRLLVSPNAVLGRTVGALRTAGPPISRLARAVRGRHLLAFDLVGVTVAAYMAVALRYDGFGVPGIIPAYLPFVMLLLVVRTLSDIRLGLYDRTWRFASIPDLERIVAAVSLGTILTLVIRQVSGFIGVPWQVDVPQHVLAGRDDVQPGDHRRHPVRDPGGLGPAAGLRRDGRPRLAPDPALRRGAHRCAHGPLRPAGARGRARAGRLHGRRPAPRGPARCRPARLRRPRPARAGRRGDGRPLAPDHDAGRPRCGRPARRRGRRDPRPPGPHGPRADRAPRREHRRPPPAPGQGRGPARPADRDPARGRGRGDHQGQGRPHHRRGRLDRVGARPPGLRDRARAGSSSSTARRARSTSSSASSRSGASTTRAAASSTSASPTWSAAARWSA